MILKCRNYSLLFLLSAVWSLLLFHYWSYDYGLYYNQAVNISEKYKLYSNIFETKGPAYYFFIHFLSKFIGVGLFQSYLTLCLTVFLFFSSIYFIISNQTKKNFFLIFFFLISILHQQNINISLPLFQFTFQILSFYFLIQSLEKNYYKNLSLSYFLFMISLFTKIDVIVYLPLYFLRLIYFENIKIKIFSILIFFIQLFLVFLFFSFSLEFSFKEFWWHNYIFNSQVSAGAWQREPFLKIFNSPYHIYLLMFTGVGIIFVEIINELLKKYKISFNNILNKKVSTSKFVFQALMIFLGGFVWLWAGTDKNFHVFMLFLPIIFCISYNYNFLDKFSFKIFFFYVLTFFFFLITLYPDTINVINYKCWKVNSHCNQMKNYTGLIYDLKNHPNDKEIFVVGSYGGWEYLLSNKKITKSLANYMLYSDIIYNNKKIVFEMPQYLIEDHIKLMNKDKGFVFWIESDLLKSVNSKNGLVASERLLKLLAISKPVENLGKFYRYEIE